jgi:hypothetical protein
MKYIGPDRIQDANYAFTRPTSKIVTKTTDVLLLILLKSESNPILHGVRAGNECAQCPDLAYSYRLADIADLCCLRS